MLKILKIKVSGYKLLKDNFDIDFTSKTRVYEEDLEKGAVEINNGLYEFNSYAFVGGNSSGKSTVLSLILKTTLFLQTGRWEYNPLEFKKDKIELEILFYLDGKVYSYYVVLGKNDNGISLANSVYSPIVSEKLYSAKYEKKKGKKNIDGFDNIKKDISDTLKSLSDTSSLVNITKDKVFVDYFMTNNIVTANEALVRNTFFQALTNCSKELLSSIIQLLDESIEYINYNNSDTVTFKRFNEEPIIMPKIELLAILSTGTFRGIELYIRAINSLKFGKVLIVDEIENSFQKNLVNNLLFLFNDSKINSKGAQLIFSTHYVEILDYLSRRDNIFITHKDDGKISVKNLYSDYNVRTELSKSKQFDNNVFNTLLNYDQLIKVRRNLLDEIHSNND